jgi:hypothetical protein
MTSDHRSAAHRSANRHTDTETTETSAHPASPFAADPGSSASPAGPADPARPAQPTEPRQPGDHPGELLSARLDEELDPATARTVDRHVASCTACRAELDGLDRARGAVRALPRINAPAGVVDRLVDERHRADRRGVALASVAAGLVVVMGLAVAEPLDRSEPAGRDVARDDIVRLESNQVDDGEAERSLGDRAYAAAADLLEFLSG